MAYKQNFYRGEEKLRRRVFFRIYKDMFWNFINKLFKKEEPKQGDEEQETLKEKNDRES
jgi:hypothetical protein